MLQYTILYILLILFIVSSCNCNNAKTVEEDKSCVLYNIEVGFLQVYSHSPIICMFRLIGAVHMRVNGVCVACNGLVICPGSIP